MRVHDVHMYCHSPYTTWAQTHIDSFRHMFICMMRVDSCECCACYYALNQRKHVYIYTISPHIDIFLSVTRALVFMSVCPCHVHVYLVLSSSFSSPTCNTSYTMAYGAPSTATRRGSRHMTRDHRNNSWIYTLCWFHSRPHHTETNDIQTWESAHATIA